MTERVPTYTAEQVRAAERPLLDEGVPLMQRAAAALADVIRDQLTTPQTDRRRPARWNPWPWTTPAIRAPAC